MKTNESLTNIFPDSSNHFTNVNHPCARLSTAFPELTGINETGKGQKQRKHIGIF